MKFTWRSVYTPEGQLEPDEFGRWALACYMHANIEKSLPQYMWVKKALEMPPADQQSDYIDVCLTWINQKGTEPGAVPSLTHRFCACCPSFNDAGNTGFSSQHNFFSNDLEELKKIVEDQFNKMELVFKNCL